MKKFILVVPSNDNEKFFVNKDYIKNLSNFNIPYYISDYNIKNINFDLLGGILLIGGGDIKPTFYNQKKHNKTENICVERDIFEINLLKGALQRKIPTLAICRGMQIMNVAFGGNINQHIEGHIQKEYKNLPTHYINVNTSSILYSIFKNNKVKVNSFHHQTVNRVAKDFKISAVCQNVIEAIEYTKNNLFFIGVQWHPESLNDIFSKKIFTYFIKSVI